MPVSVYIGVRSLRQGKPSALVVWGDGTLEIENYTDHITVVSMVDGAHALVTVEEATDSEVCGMAVSRDGTRRRVALPRSRVLAGVKP